MVVQPDKTRFLISAFAVGLVLAALTGCTQAASPKATQTITVSPTQSGPPSGTKSGSASGPSPHATPMPTQTAKASLGGTCDNLLPAIAINQAVGLPLAGKTAFVVGLPDTKIERLAYLNCRYGVAAPAKGKPAVPKVEIGLSLYASDLRAQTRVQGTTDDFVGLGARQTTVSLGSGVTGVILTGYQNPTLVASSGPRTVAVTVDAKLFRSDRNKVMVALAKAALAATANYTQGGPITPTPTPSASGTL